MKPRRSRALILAVLVLLALVPASSAYADRPTRVPYPTPGGLIPATFCGFPIVPEVSVNREYVKTFVPNDGGPITRIEVLNGTLKARIVNLDSGKSTDANFSGPERVFYYADGSITMVVEGSAVISIQLQDAPLPGYPGLFLAIGHSVARYDAAGNLVAFSTTGHIVDLCAALSN